MAYTVTLAGSNLLVGTADTTWVFKNNGAQSGILVIRGTYTKGNETATAMKMSTRATQTGTDTPIPKNQVGTDNTVIQLAPTYTATQAFEIAVPVFGGDKYIGITPTATGSATGTIAFTYTNMEY